MSMGGGGGGGGGGGCGAVAVLGYYVNMCLLLSLELTQLSGYPSLPYSCRNVLELGCGIGLVGSALACWTNNSSSSSPSSSSSSSSSSAAPSSVLLTDHHPAVLQQLTENLSLNFGKLWLCPARIPCMVPACKVTCL